MIKESPTIELKVLKDGYKLEVPGCQNKTIYKIDKTGRILAAKTYGQSDNIAICR